MGRSRCYFRETPQKFWLAFIHPNKRLNAMHRKLSRTSSGHRPYSTLLRPTGVISFWSYCVESRGSSDSSRDNVQTCDRVPPTVSFRSGSASLAQACHRPATQDVVVVVLLSPSAFRDACVIRLQEHHAAEDTERRTNEDEYGPATTERKRPINALRFPVPTLRPSWIAASSANIPRHQHRHRPAS